MQTQALFDQAPSIVMVDALAQTLGATPDGVLEYRYLDAVKPAGHSCPTVADAWLMTRVRCEIAPQAFLATLPMFKALD